VLLLVILSLFVGEICQNVCFDGSHLQTSNRAPLVSAIVIHISELGSFVPKTPEKWSCLLFYDYLLARNVKMFFDGGHFESSNMVTPLKISLGSRQI